MVRVCFLAPFPPPYGGIANWMAMMCRYMEQEKKDEIQYTLINTAPKKRVTEGRTLWNRIVGGGLDMLQIRKKMQCVLSESYYDCIHITTSGHLSFVRDLTLISLARKKKVKTLYHIRFGRVPEILKKKGWENILLKACLKRCDTIVAIDQKTFLALKQYGYGCKAYHIPLPIYTKELPEVLIDKDKTICFVGWVIRNKGIEELLEAWEQIDLKEDGWKLRVIGPSKDAYRQELLKKYSCINVEFCGELPHEKVLDYVNSSKIFVLPSYTEGFPNAVVEAMALASSVVATNVGAIPEMLDGECGYLIEKQNVDMLARALEQAACADDNLHGHNAREKVLREYEIEAVVKQYMRLWIEKKEQK